MSADVNHSGAMMQGFIFMNPFFWWLKQAVIAILSVAFFILGVQMLVASYGLANPLYFIMTFFSASLIILVGIVGILYPAIRVFTILKPKR